MNLYNYLKIEPNFIPKNIIQEILTNKFNSFSSATVENDNSKEGYISDYRKTKWLNIPSDLFLNLQNTIVLIYESYLKQYFNSDIQDIEGPQFLRYDVGDHYDIHNDCESFVGGELKRLANRDVSILLYLNDDYEGGQIEFTQLQLSLRPKAGMLLAFPSYWEFEHKVHPVTKGTRYNIVSWISTKNRIYERKYNGFSFN